MKDFRTCIRGIMHLSRPIRGRAAVSVFIGLVRIAASLTAVSLFKELIDIATGNSGQNLGKAIAALIAIFLVQIAASQAASYWENLNKVKSKNQLQRKLFSQMLGSRWNGREQFHSGDLVNRLEADIDVMTDLLCTRIPDSIITVFQLIAASIYLISMAPNLLWLLVGLMVVGIFGSKMFFRTIRAITSSIRKSESRIQQIMQENLQNRILVLTLSGAGRILGKLGAAQEELERLTVSRLGYNAVARTCMSLGFSGGYVSAFLWGVFGIIRGDVTFGMMTAFLQLAGQVQRPIVDLSRHIPAFIHALSSEERILEIEEMEQEKEDRGELLEHAPSIVFKDVCYSYPGQDKAVLDNFSFEFKAGCMTAIMGPTGAGKSTLIRLALGLLDPESGEVSRYSRRNYMYVPQGNSLMSGTIRENLQMAKEDASEEEMKEALETAAASFVMDLPDGLDSRCGETGSGLSEGQAQRIAVARALLHEGSILIMDESSSALDSETEDRMLNNITKKYRGRKTILFVSHRDKILSMADSVCRF